MIVRFFLIVCIFGTWKGFFGLGFDFDGFVVGFLASTHGIDVVDLPENKTTTTTTTTTTSTTTTETPKTTTEAPKTTTIAPKPEPTYLSGQLENKAENYTCLRYEFNVHFNIEYNTTDPNKTATASFQLPLDSKLDYLPTVCSDVNSESFNLTFGSNVLELTFKKTESSVFMDNILLTVNMTNETFPNVEKNLLSTVFLSIISLLTRFYFSQTHSKHSISPTLVQTSMSISLTLMFAQIMFRFQERMDPSMLCSPISVCKLSWRSHRMEPSPMVSLRYL